MLNFKVSSSSRVEEVHFIRYKLGGSLVKTLQYMIIPISVVVVGSCFEFMLFPLFAEAVITDSEIILLEKLICIEPESDFFAEQLKYAQDAYNMELGVYGSLLELSRASFLGLFFISVVREVCAYRK